MKTLLLVMVEDPSSGDLKNASRVMMKAAVEAKSRINNGASILITQCNAEDPQDLNSHLGKTIRWAVKGAKEKLGIPNAEYRNWILKNNGKKEKKAKVKKPESDGEIDLMGGGSEIFG